MIEIVFGESACGSLKIAQTYGKGKYRGSAVSIFMRHEDGSVPSSDEMKKAQLQAQEQERISQGNCKTVMLTWKSVAPDICDMLFSMPPNMFAFGVLHSRPILKRSVLRESITMLPSLMLPKSW